MLREYTRGSNFAIAATAEGLEARLRGEDEGPGRAGEGK